MLKFSEKEYDRLKKESSEIRLYITRLIGFIITIAGLSSYFIESIMKSNNDDPLREMLVVFISMLVITYLFVIIWYKFKSHNRFNGYIQLLMQEVDFICLNKLTEKEKNNKSYIANYKKLVNRSKKTRELINKNNLSTWEFVMSRLNSSGKLKKNKNDKEKEKVAKSLKKAKYVFQLPDDYEHSFICDCENLDIKFSNELAFDQYGKRKSFKEYTNKDKIDKRYVVNGWFYPKIITWIAFITIILFYLIFLFIHFSNYNDFASWENLSDFNYWIPVIILFGASFIFLYWIYYFILKIDDIISGAFSIEGYCWRFFIFRVQLLNSKGIIPIYFSRAFIRFFKSKLIIQHLEEPKMLNDVIKVINSRRKEANKKKENEKEFKDKIETIETDVWKRYKEHIKGLKQIENEFLREIHDAVNIVVKSKHEIPIEEVD